MSKQQHRLTFWHGTNYLQAYVTTSFFGTSKTVNLNNILFLLLKLRHILMMVKNWGSLICFLYCTRKKSRLQYLNYVGGQLDIWRTKYYVGGTYEIFIADSKALSTKKAFSFHVAATRFFLKLHTWLMTGSMSLQLQLQTTNHL